MNKYMKIKLMLFNVSNVMKDIIYHPIKKIVFSIKN